MWTRRGAAKVERPMRYWKAKPATIVTVITIFYTLVTVTLFVPIVAGLFAPTTTARGALASIVAGVGGALAIQIATGGAGWGMITPALGGLILAAVAWAISLTKRSV